jgi:hypothetical protein
VKDFVVVKTFSCYHAENPSQLQKFTVNRVAVVVFGVGRGCCCWTGGGGGVAVVAVAVAVAGAV